MGTSPGAGVGDGRGSIERQVRHTNRTCSGAVYCELPGSVRTLCVGVLGRGLVVEDAVAAGGDPLDQFAAGVVVDEQFDRVDFGGEGVVEGGAGVGCADRAGTDVRVQGRDDRGGGEPATEAVVAVLPTVPPALQGLLLGAFAGDFDVDDGEPVVACCAELPQQAFAESGPAEGALDDGVLPALQAHRLQGVEDLRRFGVHEGGEFAGHDGAAVGQCHLEDAAVDAGVEGVPDQVVLDPVGVEDAPALPGEAVAFDAGGLAGTRHPGGGEGAELPVEDDIVLFGEVAVDDPVHGAASVRIVGVEPVGGGGAVAVEGATAGAHALEDCCCRCPQIRHYARPAASRRAAVTCRRCR